jgi:hypothetical protein
MAPPVSCQAARPHAPNLSLSSSSVLQQMPWTPFWITAVFGTVVSQSGELIAVGKVPASTASLTLSLVVVWGLFFGALFNGDRLTPLSWAGAAAIIGATIIPKVLDVIAERSQLEQGAEKSSVSVTSEELVRATVSASMLAATPVLTEAGMLSVGRTVASSAAGALLTTEGSPAALGGAVAMSAAASATAEAVAASGAAQLTTGAAESVAASAAGVADAVGSIGAAAGLGAVTGTGAAASTAAAGVAAAGTSVAGAGAAAGTAAAGSAATATATAGIGAAAGMSAAAGTAGAAAGAAAAGTGAAAGAVAMAAAAAAGVAAGVAGGDVGSVIDSTSTVLSQGATAAGPAVDAVANSIGDGGGIGTTAQAIVEGVKSVSEAMLSNSAASESVATAAPAGLDGVLSAAGEATRSAIDALQGSLPGGDGMQ